MRVLILRFKKHKKLSYLSLLKSIPEKTKNIGIWNEYMYASKKGV